MTAQPIGPIEIAIMFIRACGPVTKASIANELLTQCQVVNRDNVTECVEAVINHGFGAGWIEQYDEESFCIA